MRSGAITRNLDFNASITGIHMTAALAEPCSSSTGAPVPAARLALRRIGRPEVMSIFMRSLCLAKEDCRSTVSARGASNRTDLARFSVGVA
jgi:hypothetical protein